MPSKVEDVRFRIERVRLGFRFVVSDLSSWGGSDGVARVEGVVVLAGEGCHDRCGSGRRIFVESVIGMLCSVVMG